MAPPSCSPPRTPQGASALTIGVASNAGTPLLDATEIPVLLDSGPEVTVGSTRMGTGMAQRVALNLISTLTMIRLGHVYDGLMVSLRNDNRKLNAPALRTLRHICGEEEAAAAPEESGGSIKPAALMLRGCFVPMPNARSR